MALAQIYNGTSNIAVVAQDRADFYETFKRSVAITVHTTLTWPDAAGTDYEVLSATAVTVTLPNGVIPAGAVIEGTNMGAGLLSFATGGGETLNLNAILPSTVDQYSAWAIKRTIAGGWVRVA